MDGLDTTGNSVVKHIKTEANKIYSKRQKHLKELESNIALDAECTMTEFEAYKSDLDDFYKAVKEETNKVIEKCKKALHSMVENGTPIDFVAKMMEIKNYENEVFDKCKKEIEPVATMAANNQSSINELKRELTELKELVRQLNATPNATKPKGQFSNVNLDEDLKPPDSQSTHSQPNNFRYSAQQTSFNGITHPLPQYTKVRIKHQNRVIEHLSLVQCEETNHYTTATTQSNHIV